jgi:hypothetical protein
MACHSHPADAPKSHLDSDHNNFNLERCVKNSHASLGSHTVYRQNNTHERSARKYSDSDPDTHRANFASGRRNSDTEHEILEIRGDQVNGTMKEGMPFGRAKFSIPSILKINVDPMKESKPLGQAKAGMPGIPAPIPGNVCPENPPEAVWDEIRDATVPKSEVRMLSRLARAECYMYVYVCIYVYVYVC